MMKLEDLFLFVPRNAVCRKIIIQKYPSGGESRWDIFYDEHNNEVCNFCTSEILIDERINPSTLRSTPDFVETSYIYNADGTIAARTVRCWDTVRTYRFEYEDKKVIRESLDETDVTIYENDDHGNPIKEHHYVEGTFLHTDDNEYTYDDKGRITHKINKNRMWTEFVTKTWYEYDERGNVTGIRKLIGEATSPSYQKFFYDDDDRMVKEEYYMGNGELISDTFYEYETVDMKLTE